MPSFRQLFVDDPAAARPASTSTGWPSALRKRAEHEIACDVLLPLAVLPDDRLQGHAHHRSLRFFPDLSDERVERRSRWSTRRFSTNTFPSWPLAHPYRYIAHNGEINTVQGNRNWMRAREAMLDSRPVRATWRGSSRSARRGRPTPPASTRCLELLHLGGRPLPHAVLMMIPEAWENHADDGRRAAGLLPFHSSLMEPWDGPASIAFTDGTVIGAVLDRNGLRPGRYWVPTTTGRAGQRGGRARRRPGARGRGRAGCSRAGCSSSTPRSGRIIEDEEIKAELAAEQPYASGCTPGWSASSELPDREHVISATSRCIRRQQTFGYTEEELRIILAPMAQGGRRADRLDGHRHARRGALERPRLLFDYFHQLFAQVTNPPLDAIREELVTSLGIDHRARGQPARPGPGVAAGRSCCRTR